MKPTDLNNKIIKIGSNGLVGRFVLRRALLVRKRVWVEGWLGDSDRVPHDRPVSLHRFPLNRAQLASPAEEVLWALNK